MTKVLLLNPPSKVGYLNRDLMAGLGVRIETKRNFIDGLVMTLKSAGRRMPVLSLGYLSSVLANGVKIKVVDAANTGMDAEDSVKESVKSNPDFVFAASSIPSLPFEVKILEMIKERTGARVGFIGQAASSFSKLILEKSNIDFVIKSEPETVVKKIIKRGGYRKSPGIVYK